MTKLLILDSGAFSVWTKKGQKEEINLDDYIQFCAAHPGVSYYVNLDVIPGVPNQKRTLTPDSIDNSCYQGWQNYKAMIRVLPKEKVIPVFHQNDHLVWLQKYLSIDAPYIGISPANDNTTTQKLKWMKGLRPFLFDSAGRPVVKTHGFAVTSYDLMKFWEWHSVDSASWKLSAAWGFIYLPKKKNREYDFSQPPTIVAVSPMSPLKQKRGYHVSSMSPHIKELVMEFLDYCGGELGEFRIVQRDSSYKLNREKKELWYDKKKFKVLETVATGVATSLEERLKINARFVKRANRVLPVDHIYMAGAPMPYPKLEYGLGRRLLSYDIVGHTKGGRKILRKHIRSMKEKRSC